MSTRSCPGLVAGVTSILLLVAEVAVVLAPMTGSSSAHPQVSGSLLLAIPIVLGGVLLALSICPLYHVKTQVSVPPAPRALDHHDG